MISICISKRNLFIVKYVAVYKYSSHIKSFSNIELGPQFCVVGSQSGSVVHGTEGVIYFCCILSSVNLLLYIYTAIIVYKTFLYQHTGVGEVTSFEVRL